jgi:hypothetical protein
LSKTTATRHFGTVRATNQGRLKEQGNGGFDHPLVKFTPLHRKFLQFGKKIAYIHKQTLSTLVADAARIRLWTRIWYKDEVIRQETRHERKTAFINRTQELRHQ